MPTPTGNFKSTIGTVTKLVGFRFVGTKAEMQAYLTKQFIESGANTCLFLVMPCGESLVFKHPQDVPYQNVPCTCGDPTHVFIEVQPA